jgi:hypothetical protein
MDVDLKRAIERLSEDFAGVFSSATVARYLEDSLDR